MEFFRNNPRMSPFGYILFGFLFTLGGVVIIGLGASEDGAAGSLLGIVVALLGVVALGIGVIAQGVRVGMASR